jgi:hypothetical protein
MAKKKEEVSKALQVLYEKMQELDIEDSYGIVLLKTGMALKANNFFQYMLNQWMDYKMAKATGNKESLEEIMKDTGGILSNGELNLDLDSVMGMIAVYQIEQNNKEEESDHIDDYASNVIHNMSGDSKPISYS